MQGAMKLVARAECRGGREVGAGCTHKRLRGRTRAPLRRRSIAFRARSSSSSDLARAGLGVGGPARWAVLAARTAGADDVAAAGAAPRADGGGGASRLLLFDSAPARAGGPRGAAQLHRQAGASSGTARRPDVQGPPAAVAA
eukprot:scaffold2831_cov330-Prasinococcus_capsulatus_cf.AAC.1